MNSANAKRFGSTVSDYVIVRDGKIIDPATGQEPEHLAQQTLKLKERFKIMINPEIYLCGVETEPYTAFSEVAAFSPAQAAEEYCYMWEGGWDGDHFNLTEESSRLVKVFYRKSSGSPESYSFKVELSDDSDDEYVITEV